MRFDKTVTALLCFWFSSTFVAAVERRGEELEAHSDLDSDQKEVDSISLLTDILHREPQNESIMTRKLKKGEGIIASGCASGGKLAKKGGSSVTDPCASTIWDQIQARSSEFSKFIELVELTGIQTALSNPIPRRARKVGFSSSAGVPPGRPGMTVFVPTNAAFDKITPKNLLDKYLDFDTWTDNYIETVLYYHRVPNVTYLASDFVDGQVVKETAPLPTNLVFNDGSPPTLSNPPFLPVPAKIIEVDNIASNGVFHVIDQVLTHPRLRVPALQAAQAVGGFSKFLELLQTAGLIDDLSGAGPYTIYPVPDPVFEAYEKASPGFFQLLKKNPNLASALKYHYVVGELVCACDDKEVTNAAGTKLKIDNIGGENYTVNGVATVPDSGALATSNAFIGVLTNFLFPLS